MFHTSVFSVFPIFISRNKLDILIRYLTLKIIQTSIKDSIKAINTWCFYRGRIRAEYESADPADRSQDGSNVLDRNVFVPNYNLTV